MMASELILQEIVEMMRCDKCKTHLRPPIHYCRDTTNICESCKSDTDADGILGVNKKLENIGSLLKYPCCFANFGCRVYILWSEAKSHESECPFRQFDCPSCVLWKGTAENLKTHMESTHQSLILSAGYTNFSLMKKQSMYFIRSIGEQYVLFYNCDTDAGLLWFTLKYIGPLEHAKRRHFKLILEHEDGIYYERKQVESAVDWNINEDVAIKIDLCVLRMKLQLKSENVVKFRTEVHSRIPLYNGSVDEDLLRDVECPVCQDYMTAPIKQCIAGHSICNYCRPKLKTCPICKQDMSEVRNFALESVCSKMYYKCMYADDGCTFASLPKDIFKHEDNCNYGFFDCPFKAFIASCTWRGKLDQMSSHTLEEHGWKF